MGSRARVFLDYFYQHPQEGEVVALHDSIVEKAEFFKKEFFQKAPGPEMKIYKDLEDMLDKSSIDVLFISTPDFAHAEPSVAASGLRRRRMILIF